MLCHIYELGDTDLRCCFRLSPQDFGPPRTTYYLFSVLFKYCESCCQACNSCFQPSAAGGESGDSKGMSDRHYKAVLTGEMRLPAGSAPLGGGGKVLFGAGGGGGGGRVGAEGSLARHMLHAAPDVPLE